MRKIKILWVSNVPPFPLNENDKSSSGGWLQGSLNAIRVNSSIELVLSFPLANRTDKERGVMDGIPYFGFYATGYPKYLQLRGIHRRILTQKIQKVIEIVDPDILHVFGAEFMHSQIAIETFRKPEATLIHIQGIVSVAANHVLLGIPALMRHLVMPSSVLHGTIAGRARRWRLAGKNEVKAIERTGNIAGRTEWDEACTMQINPQARYFHCGESLRSNFYEPASHWNLENSNRCSIYFSQGFDQVKGLHLVLSVLGELIKRFPTAHLYVGGPSPVSAGFLKRRSYGFYINSLIKKFQLDKHITFLGPQNTIQVVENLKQAHVFLSASLIENSPNAVGEALLMGVPTISSDVGGVKDFIEHGKNGFIYPVDEPYMIPYYIRKIFENDDIAMEFSKNGRASASEAYNLQKNSDALISIYEVLSGEK